jgi:hypothetical protein
MLRDGLVASQEHVLQNPGDRLPGGGIAPGPPRQQRRESAERGNRDPADHPDLSR